MAKFTVVSYVGEAARDAAIALLQLDANDLHVLYGGDRVESAAVGIGPTAKRWLRDNGPPTTTGYSAVSVDTDTSEVRLRMLDDVPAQLAADAARPLARQRLSAGKRASLTARWAAAQDRGRASLPGGEARPR